ncbi:hypothetical protein EAE96_005214 [Botrytis aclada]|nr:hypothetical protein EAE96_005214 [Botrytis aclada]
MNPENKLTVSRCKKLSCQALTNELQKRRSKRYRVLERRWKMCLSRRQLFTLRKFPIHERHDTRNNPLTSGSFSELPFEIRIKIWKYAFRGRNVEVCVDFDVSVGYDAELQIEAPHYPPQIVQCHTITQNPKTLYIDHESRMETLKYYYDLLPGVSDFPIYFNYQLYSFAFHHYCLKHNIRGSDTMEQLALGITNLSNVSSSVLLRPIRSLTFPTCFLYDYGITNPHHLRPPANISSTFIEPILTEFDCLQEIIIISGTPDKNCRSSGFNNPFEVQHLESCLTNSFEAEMDKNPSFQSPKVTIYTEPFLLPVFRDEMEQANDSRVYENYDLKETADWFDSEN